MRSNAEVTQEASTNNNHTLFYNECSTQDPDKTIGERFLDGSIKTYNDGDLKLMNGVRLLYYFPWIKENRSGNIQAFVDEVAGLLTEKECFALVDKLTKLELKKGEDAYRNASLAQVFLRYLIVHYMNLKQEDVLNEILSYLINTHVLSAMGWNLQRHQEKINALLKLILPLDLKDRSETITQSICDQDNKAAPELSDELAEDLVSKRDNLLRSIAIDKEYQKHCVSEGYVDLIMSNYSEGRNRFFSHQSPNTAKLFSDLGECRFDADRGAVIDTFMRDPANQGRRAYHTIRLALFQRYGYAGTSHDHAKEDPMPSTKGYKSE